MTNKELLVLAAKAVGYKLSWGQIGLIGGDFVDCTDMAYAESGQPDVAPAFWDPLNDDGDALRLAVKLKIGIDHAKFVVFARDDHGNDLTAESVASAIPREKATRRAIVRAAAEIGKAMP